MYVYCTAICTVDVYTSYTVAKSVVDIVLIKSNLSIHYFSSTDLMSLLRGGKEADKEQKQDTVKSASDLEAQWQKEDEKKKEVKDERKKEEDKRKRMEDERRKEDEKRKRKEEERKKWDERKKRIEEVGLLLQYHFRSCVTSDGTYTCGK